LVIIVSISPQKHRGGSLNAGCLPKPDCTVDHFHAKPPKAGAISLEVLGPRTLSNRVYIRQVSGRLRCAGPKTGKFSRIKLKP
jgi:hypothetical protein